MKNEKKISKNKIADWSDKMDTKYGKQGSETRTNFETKAQAFYIGELLKEGRKQAKLTQKQMAEKEAAKKKENIRALVSCYIFFITNLTFTGQYIHNLKLSHPIMENMYPM